MPPKSASSPFDDKQKVFAKMPGYPWWPAFITPEEYVPKQVQRAKKKGTPYCVIFIPDGDFYWSTEKGLKEFKLENSAKDLKKLDPKTISRLKDVKYLRKRLTSIPKKQASFPEAIAASENLAFDDFITIFQEEGDEAEEEKEEDEDEEVEEEDEVEELDETVKKAAPLKSRNRSETKGRRSSRTQDIEDEGEDGDVEDQYQEEIPKNKKKRGSVVQASTNGKKRKLTDSTAKKEPEAESNKKPRLENSSDEDTANAAGAAAASIKSGKAPVNDEEKQHQLYLCRIKLQRTLIQRDIEKTPPTADELLLVRLILYRLVNFPVDKELLKKTKLYKVMRYILKNPDLEYSDSFKLHELCKEILEKWDPYIQQILYEKEQSNEKNTNSNSRLLSVKNGGSGFNDDSEVSGIEQSLPEIEQSKDEGPESVEKKVDERESAKKKTESDVPVKKEIEDASQETNKENAVNGVEVEKGDSELQANLDDKQTSQLDGVKPENVTENIVVTGEANNKDEAKETEITVDTINTGSKDDSVKTGSQSESVATKETTAPTESVTEAHSVSNDVDQAAAAVSALANS